MTARILIVDDEPLVALDMESAVLGAGFQIAGIARSVKEALEYIERGGIDVVILDANLNGDSAAPVADRLRAAGLRFVAVSGYSRIQLDDWLGEAPLIAKPFAPEHLIDEIKRLSGRP